MDTSKTSTHQLSSTGQKSPVGRSSSDAKYAARRVPATAYATATPRGTRAFSGTEWCLKGRRSAFMPLVSEYGCWN